MSLHAVFTEWNEIGMNQKLIQKNTDTYTNTDTEPDFKQSHSFPSFLFLYHSQPNKKYEIHFFENILHKSKNLSKPHICKLSLQNKDQ